MAAAAQAGLLQQQAELERKAAELEKKERELQSNAASINRECRSPQRGPCPGEPGLSGFERGSACPSVRSFLQAVCLSSRPSQQHSCDCICHPIADKVGNKFRIDMLGTSSAGSLPLSVLSASTFGHVKFFKHQFRVAVVPRCLVKAFR